MERSKPTEDVDSRIDRVTMRERVKAAFGMPASCELCPVHLSRDTYINIMGQYRPCYRARNYPPLCRSVNRKEVEEGMSLSFTAGLHRGFGEESH